MIINIPLQIDDEYVNGVIAKDYEAKITANLTKMVEAGLKRRARGYYCSKEDGVMQIVEEHIDSIIQSHKELIIEKASDKLAERLSRTKKAKELAKE